MKIMTAEHSIKVDVHLNGLANGAIQICSGVLKPCGKFAQRMACAPCLKLSEFCPEATTYLQIQIYCDTYFMC